MNEAAQRLWLEQWRGAGPALEAHRREELRSLSAAEALAAAQAVLWLASPDRLSEARRSHSGLVEQQRLFHPRLPR